MGTIKRLTSRSLQRNAFLLSLLLHLILLFGLTLVWVKHKNVEKKPSLSIPSYVYQAPLPKITASSISQQTKKTITQPSLEKETISTSAQVRHASQTASSTATKVTEAIHLVGDKKTVPKPLIVLLGKALAAHLIYPKIAMDFRVRGMAFVSFVLHPDGTLTNVELVQSSHAGVLDDEALRAVTAISPVKQIHQYVEKPKSLVVGIIFD